MSKFGVVSKGLSLSVSTVAMLVASSAFAQDATNAAGASGSNDPLRGECANLPADAPIPPDCQAEVLSNDGTTAAQGGIVVTGSRISRPTTYSSASPLQVLETETLQDTGQFDAASILQQSEYAAGQQIDATFQGYVLNNGPGSQTLDLRGLGADRTLLLVNGRRLAPSGVEGAPTSPSINLLPSSLIARYDLLLDGASSVYGSDAVAGVGNIVLRKDLDGLELFADGNYSSRTDIDNYSFSGAWGKRGSNFQIGIGAEYSHRGEIRLKDRPWLAGCDRNFEVTQSGEVRSLDVASNALALADSGGAVQTSQSECKIGSLAGRIQVASTYFGSIYYDPNTYTSTGQAGNSYIPGYSESIDVFGVPVDRNGDGFQDVDYQKVNLNGANQNTSFISPQDLYNVMAYGEYTFAGDANITPFFEANYSRSEVTAKSNTPQLFPWVPSSNPTNPCNITAGGVDCRGANNQFENFVPGGGFPASYALSTGFRLPVRPIVSVNGDRDNVATVQEQYRGVLGVRGDLPFINISGLNDWTFEIAGVYSHSKGTSVRRGIRGDKLAFALGIDPTADYGGLDTTGDGINEGYDYGLTSPPLTGGACNAAGLRNPNLAAPDLLEGCVPVNLFAPSLFGVGTGGIGDFATQGERDYLMGERTFLTTYDQIDVSAFIQGSVFNMQGGSAKAVLGGEFRKDKLNSQPDFVASNGLFWGYFADQGARGSKDTYEVFGELDLPVLADVPAAEELHLNLSGRATHDEFYGWNETYSVKLGWRPVKPLLLKLAAGTSFRAPNLRENFLGGQSGFGTLIDPCAVPDSAYSPVGGGYLPGKDTRNATVLANCVREGRDPTRVGIEPGLNSTNQTSTEITSGGSFALDPETSDSFTTGFAFNQRFGGVNFDFNFNYYNIRVSGAIAEPTGQFVVNQCFLDTTGNRSAYCDAIGYNTDPNSRQLISDVFAGFVNINKETVKGIDLNSNFSTNVMIGGQDVSLGLNLRANHLIQRNTVLLDNQGNPILSEDAGTFGFPSWTGRGTFTAKVNRLAFTWQTRWVGKVSAKEQEDTNPFTDAFGYGPDGNYTGYFSDTCTGGGSRDANGVPDGVVAGDGTYCRNIGWAGDYFIHTASLRYTTDRWEARIGVANLFDKAPPRVDSSEVFAIANTPVGNGYDYYGREFFASAKIRF